MGPLGRLVFTSKLDLCLGVIINHVISRISLVRNPKNSGSSYSFYNTKPGGFS